MSNTEKKFAEFSIGDSAEFEENISAEMVTSFAELSKDFNPLHIDPEYAKTTQFGKTIAHGMIAGALISRLLGMYLPGKYCLFLKNNLIFKTTIYPNTTVLVLGKVTHKTESANLLTIQTKVINKNTKEICVEGEALVKVLK